MGQISVTNPAGGAPLQFNISGEQPTAEEMNRIQQVLSTQQAPAPVEQPEVEAPPPVPVPAKMQGRSPFQTNPEDWNIPGPDADPEQVFNRYFKGSAIDWQNVVGYRTANLKDGFVNEDPTDFTHGFEGELIKSPTGRTNFQSKEEVAKYLFDKGATHVIYATPENSAYSNWEHEPVPSQKAVVDFRTAYQRRNEGDVLTSERVPDFFLSGTEVGGKLIDQLIPNGLGNPYLLEDLAILEATGELDMYRASQKSTEVITGWTNAGIYAVEGITSTLNAIGDVAQGEDWSWLDKDGKMKVDLPNFSTAAENLAERIPGLTPEAAESVMLFAPTVLDSTANTAGEIATDLATGATVRRIGAGIAMRGWEKWLYKNFKTTDLKEAAQASGKDSGAIFNQYLSDTVAKGSGWWSNWRRTTRAESLDIVAASKGKSKEYIKQYVQPRLTKAEKALSKNQAILKKYEPGTREYATAEKAVQRSMREVNKIKSEMVLPPYFKQVAREFPVAVVAAGGFYAIAQDVADIKNPTVQSFVMAGTSISAAIAPSVFKNSVTAPVLIPLTGLRELGRSAGLLESPSGLEKLGLEGQRWLQQLSNLDDDAYEAVVSFIDDADQMSAKMLSMRDPTTGEPMFTDNDVQLTVASLINLPMLRIQQEALRESASLGGVRKYDATVAALDKSIMEEANSLNRFARALDGMAEGHNPGANPEFDNMLADFNALHTALSTDHKNKIAALEAEIDVEEANIIAHLSGSKISADDAGNYEMLDHGAALENLDSRREWLLALQGKDKSEIIEEMAAISKERLAVTQELARKARIDGLVDPSQDPSSILSINYRAFRRDDERRIAAEYDEWRSLAGGEDTYMDGTWIYNDLMQSGDIEKVAEDLAKNNQLIRTNGVISGAQTIGGETIPAQTLRGLEAMFGEGAARDFAYWTQKLGGEDSEVLTKLMVEAGINRNDVGFVKWKKLNHLLKNADNKLMEALDMAGTSPAILQQMGDKMRLPVDARDMQLVTIGLGDKAATAARSKSSVRSIQGKTIARTRENFFAIAESDEYGFRRNFYQENGDGTWGESVGPELTEGLQEINGRWVDQVILPHRTDDTVMSWGYASGGRKAKVGDNVSVHRKGTGPAFTFQSLRNNYNQAKGAGGTAAQNYEAVESPLALAFGGRRTNEQGYGGVVTRITQDGEEIVESIPVYRLDNASPKLQVLKDAMALEVKQKLMGSKGFRNFLKHIDPDTDANPESVKYLQAILDEKKWEDIPDLTAEDLEYLDYLGSLRSYSFDEAGNIIPGSGEPVVDIENLMGLIGFDKLRQVNKVAAEADRKAVQAVKDAATQVKRNKQVLFSAENHDLLAAESIARTMSQYSTPELGRADLYTNLIAGGKTSGIRQKLFEEHANTIRILGREKNLSAAEIEKQVELGKIAFDKQLKYEVSSYINDEVMKFGSIGAITDGTEVTRAVTVDFNKLDELIGSTTGSVAQRKTAENLIELLGEDHYDNIETIARFQARKNAAYDKVRITGEAKAMSLESWLSRFYSISRGVVSPRYVLSEALIQHSRIKGQSMFMEALANPDVANYIADAIRTGNIPTDAEMVRRFDEALIAAMARSSRYLSDTSAEDIEQIVTPQEEEQVPETSMVMPPQSAPLDNQMQSLLS